VVAAGDFAKLQSGELAPQSAFLQGLVKVQGDMGFAMLLGTALLA
jgi:putative sterol carrier protein